MHLMEMGMKNNHINGISRLGEVFIVFALSVVVYLNAIPNGFVIDDLSQVVNNQWIRNVKYIPDIFSSSVWSFEGRDSNYYRPLMHIFYMCVYHIAGLKPWVYHLVNVLFNSSVCILVLLTSSRLFHTYKTPSFFGYFSLPLAVTILFSSHPIHTEAVAWVAGILDLSFTFFYLLSLYFYMRSRQGYNTDYIISVASFFLSTLCKEPALTLPAILVAYDYVVEDGSRKSLDLLKRYIPYIVVSVIYVYMRYMALKGFAPVKLPVDMGLYQYVINIVVLFSDYLGKLLLPIDLNIWHVFSPIDTLVSVIVIISILVSGIFLALVWISFSKNKLVFFSLLIIVLPLLPVMYIPALTQGSENAFAERYLYLPSFGFVLLIGTSMEWVLRRKPNWTTYFGVALLATFLLYSVGTVSRNFVWKDSYTLWSDAVRKSPHSAKAHEVLGYALLHQGREEEGLKELQTALLLKPDLLEQTIGKGIAYGKKGFTDKAIFQFVSASLMKPDSAEAHFNLGAAYDNKGWIDLAVKQYEISLILAPNHAEAHNNLGVAYSMRGSLDKGIMHLQEAVRLTPGDESFRINLAKAYELKGQNERADTGKRLLRNPEKKQK